MNKHLENATRIFYPPTKQSFTADIAEMRRELSAASAGMSMDDPDEAAILNHIFAADSQLRVMDASADKLASYLDAARAASRPKSSAQRA
jgi:hypothetical protein